MSLLQNDPSEALEVFDAAGHPTGIARPRSAIHLNGDWHQAFHCWILRRGGREIVMQRRSRHKDTFAELWDATAAGHWRFGETAEEASREIDEELGLHIPFAQLEYRGREVSDRAFPSGLIDREHHQVYVWLSDLSLRELRPNAAEVSAVAAFPSDDLLAVLSGTLSTVRAVEAIEVLPSGEVRFMSDEVHAQRKDFVPYTPERIRGMLGHG